MLCCNNAQGRDKGRPVVAAHRLRSLNRQKDDTGAPIGTEGRGSDSTLAERCRYIKMYL